MRILAQLRALVSGRRPSVATVDGTAALELPAAPRASAPAEPRPVFGKPPQLLDRSAPPPLTHQGPLKNRTTRLLPRMVARIGPASFAEERFDFIDDLPELRPLERPAVADEADQVTALAALAIEHAHAHPPDPTSFPALAMRVMDRATDKKTSTAELVGLVAQDAAIAASILRIANSPVYARGGAPVTQLKVAVGQLGIDEVRRVAAGVASRALYDLESVATYSQHRQRWDGLFHRSMTTAFTCGWLATQLKMGSAERAFLGGMFHDIGKTLALRSISALEMGGRLPFPPGQPVPEAVIDSATEALHVELGVRMHEAWGLPDDLLLICRMHHDWAPPAEPDLRTLHVVRLCSALADLRAAPARSPAAADMIRTSVRALQIQFAQYRVLTARLNSFAEQVSAMFQIEEHAASPLPEARARD